MTAPCALYRHFDAEGRLLYVGISLSAITRLSQHRDKPWFADIVSMTTEWHPSRIDALRAEREAIRRELPQHNVQHAVRHRLLISEEETGWSVISAKHHDEVKIWLDGKSDGCLFAIDIASRIMRVPTTTLNAMVDVPDGHVPRIRMKEMYVLLDRLRNGDHHHEPPLVLQEHADNPTRAWFYPRCGESEDLVHRKAPGPVEAGAPPAPSAPPATPGMAV